eukprot:9992066-Alexandrium_andersonii.AAC.1
MLDAQMAALPADVVPLVMGDYNIRISRCEPWVGVASSKVTDACGARALDFMRKWNLAALNTFLPSLQPTCFAST